MMNNPSSGFEIFRAILTLGLALWSCIVVANNLVGFSSAAGAIARTMSMAPLEAEPRIESPLYSRKLTKPIWSRLALCVLLACQIVGAVGLAVGGAGFAAPFVGLGTPSMSAIAATLGLAAHTFAMILMMSGGLWFGYWIRQEGLKLTHIALLVLISVAALVVNG